jgi:hypothetical protein
MKLQVDVDVMDIPDALTALDEVAQSLANGMTDGEVEGESGQFIGRFELLKPQEPLSDAEAAALPPIR